MTGGSNLPDYMPINPYMTNHGRPLPVATSANLPSLDLLMPVVTGDLDTYCIGSIHLVTPSRPTLPLPPPRLEAQALFA